MTLEELRRPLSRIAGGPNEALHYAKRQVRPLPGYLVQFAGSIPLPSMIALIVPSGRIRPR